MTNQTSDIDRFDRKILDVLAVDGRISVTELARRIGLSKSPTQARLKRLEDRGVIRGYRAITTRFDWAEIMWPLLRSNCRTPARRR